MFILVNNKRSDLSKQIAGLQLDQGEEMINRKYIVFIRVSKKSNKRVNKSKQIAGLQLEQGKEMINHQVLR